MAMSVLLSESTSRIEHIQPGSNVLDRLRQRFEYLRKPSTMRYKIENTPLFTQHKRGSLKSVFVLWVDTRLFPG